MYNKSLFNHSNWLYLWNKKDCKNVCLGEFWDVVPQFRTPNALTPLVFGMLQFWGFIRLKAHFPVVWDFEFLYQTEYLQCSGDKRWRHVRDSQQVQILVRNAFNQTGCQANKLVAPTKNPRLFEIKIFLCLITLLDSSLIGAVANCLVRLVIGKPLLICTWIIASGPISIAVEYGRVNQWTKFTLSSLNLRKMCPTDYKVCVILRCVL